MRSLASVGAVKDVLARLRPRSMAGQLIGLLLCGLLSAHLIALLVSPKGNGAMHALARRQAFDNVATAYRLAQLQVPAASADAALAVLDSETVSFRRAAMRWSDGGLSDRETDAVQQSLRERLQLPADAVRVIWRTDAGGKRALAVALRLSGGGWLLGEQHPVIDSQWWRPLRFSIPVSTLPVLAIVIIFVRRIVRPVRALALAAERVSRGEYSAPSPLSGPREAREVTAAFNIMQERLARYLHDKRRMLGSVSHDLRSIATTLRLRAELVEDDVLRGAMQRTLRDMSAMIEKALRFARDDAADESAADLDLLGLLGEVVADQAARGHAISLASPRESLACRCRPLALKRALNNLVDNAVRYGGGAHIAGERSCEPDGTALLRIAIEDDGPGIAPDQLERVFQPFVRLQPGCGREAGGVGLGLAIARSYIDAHGGRLTLENRAGGGLRALIMLPA